MKNFKNKNSQLTLSQRITIEEMINQRKRKFEIANALNKNSSTITREIQRHIKIKYQNIHNRENLFNCRFFKSCKICTEQCNIFMPITCSDRDRNIGACNNCSKLKTCRLDKYFYEAKRAQNQYEYTLTDSRQGVNLSSTQLVELAHIICPLIKNGQSIYTILNNHPEITQCEKTIYNYIELGLFRDWDVTNITLKRKTSRKVSKKDKLKKRKEPADYNGRSYADYLEYKAKYPNIPTTEMDTVYNNQNGPYIQTFIFENTSFMIGILHKKKDVNSMSGALNKFQEILDDEFKRLFSLLLTDRGTEFMRPEKFEINLETGELRSAIFYCDPQQSSQKPHVENNHNMVRDILPNGQSWNHLTQEKVNLMFSHINSTSRENLGGKTPYEIFTFIYGKEIAKKLGIQEINKDEIILKPRLLK